MSRGDDDAGGAQVLAWRRPKRPDPAPCTCHGTIAIAVDVAGHRATLHLCQWCGDSWDIDGAPAAAGAVHALVPKSAALSAVWRRSMPGAVRPGRGQDRRSRACRAPTNTAVGRTGGGRR